MEWSRVKSILICVFACVNIFLMFTYMGDSSPAKSVSGESVDNTVEILNMNNVIADSKIIPVNISSIKVFNVENTYALPEEMKDVLPPEAENFSVGEDSFSFDLKVDAASGLKEKELSKLAVSTAKSLGLIKKSKYQTIAYGNDVICIYPVYDDKRIIDSRLIFRFDSGKAYVTAENWLMDVISDSSIVDIPAITESLINFATYDGRDKTNQVSINNIRLCYYVGSRGGQVVNVSGTPVWEFETSDGKRYFYDVRSSELLKIEEGF